MLKKRLIIVLTFNDGVLFRTKVFHPDYRYTSNFVDAWSVDEIVMLDVTRPGNGSPSNFYDAVERMAKKCFVPLAVGGGVRNISDFKNLLGLGADKVVINSQALETPTFISEAANLYGSQCVVVSIDAKMNASGKYEVYSHQGTRATGLGPVEWALQSERAGAGEILITSIERDGSLEGYDNRLNRMVSDAVEIPVLVCGGAGKWVDFVDGFVEGGASAVCTTNIYHFTETSIKSAKAYLLENGIDVRK